MLAAYAPSLTSALLAAEAAGYGHVIIDGTLIATDRCRTPGPAPGVDLWWSGEHDNHGGTSRSSPHHHHTPAAVDALWDPQSNYYGIP